MSYKKITKSYENICEESKIVAFISPFFKALFYILEL